MTTIENPVMQLHDIAGEQFVKAVTDIIVTTIGNEKCDDAINEIIKEYVSDESIMNEDEVEEKIESRIESAIDNVGQLGSGDSVCLGCFSLGAEPGYRGTIHQPIADPDGTKLSVWQHHCAGCCGDDGPV